MLNYLQIENFKSLKTIGIPVGRLNLFFGMNGMGKSSVLQSLLLLRQSYWMNDRKNLDRLYLNGPMIRLGNRRDVFSQTRDSQYLHFYLKFEGKDGLNLRYQYGTEGEEIGTDILNSEMEGELSSLPAMDNVLFNGSFFYLGAEHIRPQNYYSADNYDAKGMNPLGTRGEYVIPFLATAGNRITVPEIMCYPGTKNSSLTEQVSAWLGTISPGVKVVTQFFPMEQRAKLSFHYDRSWLTSDDVAPANTGFGVTYVLPLITELLLSDRNTMILIENPESHLHPRGQAAMAQLMALAAKNGAQIFCESHSDHIINGVRVAIHDGNIPADDTYIGYFDKNDNQETVVTDILIDKNGNLSNYPDGLLDEWGIEMAKLL